MVEVFNVTFTQVFVLAIFISLGYWLKKSGRVPDSFSKALSQAEVTVFMPLVNLGNFAVRFKSDIILEKSVLVIASTILLAATFTIANLLTRFFTKKGLERDVYIYSLTIPNISYFGIPIISAVFGPDTLFDFLIFTIPFNIFIYTFGMYILNPNKVFSMRNLLNIPTLALLAGMIIGLINVPLPKIFTDITDMGSACMAPVAMLLTGFVFASSNFIDMISKAKVYFITAIKMILLPLLALLIMLLLNIRTDIIQLVVATLCLPAGLNSIVFPEAFDGDSKTGASLCFVTTVMGIILIPLVFSILELTIK